MKNKIVLIVTSLSSIVVSASASTINYAEDVGTAYQTPAISTFNTYGDDMDGMDVWVTFSNGTTEHAIWDTTGAQSGAATVGGYFSISESGDTYANSAWTLQNLNRTLSITSFTLFGVNGNTTFDRSFGGQIGTLNSALGKDFSIGGNYSVTATYGDELSLTGAAAVGDEWEQLSVAFANGTFFAPNSSAAFTQDTDNAAVKGTITPKLPDAGSTSMMLGMGLIGVAALKRRLAKS
jgi:hypothetical protein